MNSLQFRGTGNYQVGPKSEYSKIQKWGDRSFEDP